MTNSLSTAISRFLWTFLVLLLLLLGFNIYQHQKSTKEIQKDNADLKTLQKSQEKSEAQYLDLQKQITLAEESVFKDITGFSKDDIKNDNAIVEDYLNTIFTWTNGTDYNKQRQEIKDINAKGTKELLDVIMKENYTVSVPKGSEGKIKNNDIDVNGIKAKLTANQAQRLTWEKSSSADVTYVNQITYQVYIDDDDLSGENKTTRNLMFTTKLSGVGKDRKVVDVKFAFLP